MMDRTGDAALEPSTSGPLDEVVEHGIAFDVAVHQTSDDHYQGWVYRTAAGVPPPSGGGWTAAETSCDGHYLGRAALVFDVGPEHR